MLTDETSSNTSTSIESACLPIGCSVSAKYRGAFCSAKVKTVERQVKLKVTLFNTGDTVTISEEEIVHPVPLCIGNTVLIHSSNSHHSRSGLAALINDNHQKQQGTIKQIYDNSVYTVVFNDGDEKSLRRSSLCLHGIRLYQTKIGQQKVLEDIPTLSTIPKDQNDMTSIVAVRRYGNQAFPALILKRKSLADYIWVKSFLDGREYIVHKRDDVESYKNNSEIQSLCRSTSKQATKVCEKFIKYNQIPLVWQKKKKRQYHNEQEHANDSNTSEPDVDDSDNETTEEKDSFVAQLFAFMDDRGTPINNIPKINNYDLDLHRLFKIVRMFGGYNKVTKNDQWNRIYIKMGLPDEPSTKTGRAIEHAYKKYLFAYEDLSKKLGTMNALSAYCGGRTSMSGDSRRSLIRVRQQSEEKKPSMPIKQQTRKRLSVDSKSTLSSIKNQPNAPRRKTIIIKPSLSSSESDTSDIETNSNNNNKMKKNSKKMISTIKKPPIMSDDKKKTTGTKNSSLTDLRSSSAPVRKSKSTTETENTMKPVIKIPKISYEILMESTLAIQKTSKKQQVSKNHDNTSTSNPSLIDSIKQSSTHDLTPLQVTPVSPSPPPSINDESSSVSVSIDTPSIFQTIIPSSITNQQSNEIETFSSNSNKRSYENCESNQKLDESSKRSRHSQDSNDKTQNRLIYEDISINDILLVKFDFNQKKEYHSKCLEKNHTKKQLFIHYEGLDSKYDEWIDIDRVIQRTSSEENKSNDPDTGIWKSLLTEDIYSSTNAEKYYQPSENRISNIEHSLSTSDNLLHSLPIKEEIIDNSSSISLEPITPCVLSITIPNSPPDNRRTSIRQQQQRRTFQNPKDSSSSSLKKRTRLDFDYNSNFNLDSITNGDNSPIPIEQESKRYRTVGKRSIKRTVNQQDNEIEDFHLHSPINVTLRQQLEDMFKHRSSRYNFLDLNNNLTGDRRLAHLKDRMRQCQKVFFNLKGALTKIEKQRKIFLRRQKPLLPQSTTTDLLLPSTCT